MNELELYVDSLDPSLSNEEKVRLVQEWKKANRWNEQEVEVSEQVELEEVDLGTVKKKDGVAGADVPSVSAAPEDTGSQLENIFSELVVPEDELLKITNKTAAVVIESIQAEAGIILPNKAYLKAMKNRCYEVGALLILDDIQMGFGRTGKLFSFENYDYEPHIITLAKGMGGGMPIGAFVASKEMMDALQSKPALGHITTFGGHPVSCAAAMASLQVIIEENLSEKANEKGKIFTDTLKKHPLVKEVRQQGLMLAVDLGSEELGAKAMEVLWKNKLIVDQFLFNRTSFRIAPPLTISIEEIEDICEVLMESLDGI